MKWKASWRKFLTPPESRLTPEWSEKNVVVNSRGSNPGPWKRSQVSALCRPGGPVEALDDPHTEIVVLCKGAQTGGTYTAYCWLAKEMDVDPGSALVVMSTIDIARKKSQGVWRPMWEDSPSLRSRVPVRDRRRQWTNLKQRINGSDLFWIGANSAANLASVDIRRLVLDEEDKYPQSFGRGSTKHGHSDSASEAGAKELAMQRIKTFQRIGTAKVFELSTPTDDRGPIWVAYDEGDKRKLFVPCWQCGIMEIMDWKSFVLDMDLAKIEPLKAINGCRYKCQHCGALHDDEQRFSAIDKGEWRPTAIPKDPKCKSFQAPSWISKFVLHDYLARKWIRAQGNRSAMQDFLNGEAAEPFVHYENCIKDEVFATLEGAYVEGQRFADCEPYKSQYGDGAECFVIGGVDVQKGYLRVVFRAFMKGGDSGLVWAGTASDFEALDAKAAEFDAKFIFIDQRYRKREVQEWCAAHSGYIPCEGVKTSAQSVFTAGTLDLDEGKHGQGRGRDIEMLRHDGDQIKDILATMIDKREGARRWMIPKGYGGKSDYVKQMSAERCVNGKWINPGDRPNHAWDCECLCIVGALWMKVLQVGALES
jgi:phage terminase large subunit GpA-like protein